MRAILLICVLCTILIVAKEPDFFIQILDPIPPQTEIRAYEVLRNGAGKVFAYVTEDELKDLKKQFSNIDILHRTKDQPPPGYRNLQQVYDYMKQLVQRFPKMLQMFDLSEAYNGGVKTFEGRSLHALKLSKNVLVEQDLPSVLIVATFHAREIINAELVLRMTTELCEQYGKDELLTRFVNSNEIYIVPIVNPDGYNYVFTKNRAWRKNLREGYGVDLNRNFDIGWYSKCAGSSDKNSIVYKGPYPLSEPEVATMANFSRKLQFAKMLDFHSWGRVVYSGYSKCSPHPEAIQKYIVRRATDLAKTIQYRAPPAIGDSDSQHRHFHLKTDTFYSHLVETYENTFQPSFEEALNEIKRVRPLWLAFFNQTIPLSGHVKEEGTQRPISGAEIQIMEFEFKNGEKRFTAGKFGRFDLMIPGGEYNLKFTASGYMEKIVRVTVPDEYSNKNVELTVLLKKLK